MSCNICKIYLCKTISINCSAFLFFFKTALVNCSYGSESSDIWSLWEIITLSDVRLETLSHLRLKCLAGEMRLRAVSPGQYLPPSLTLEIRAEHLILTPDISPPTSHTSCLVPSASYHLSQEDDCQSIYSLFILCKHHITTSYITLWRNTTIYILYVFYSLEYKYYWNIYKFTYNICVYYLGNLVRVSLSDWISYEIIVNRVLWYLQRRNRYIWQIQL